MNAESTAANNLNILGDSMNAQLNMSVLPIGKTSPKGKQIVVRFDQDSYEKVSEQAKAEHRGLGELVRHATLDYIERLDNSKTAMCN